ncbi:hypothetical protein [Colwellia sp. C1TZA3]|nr:hypothetical protein [Colwellia sp. C1TZA3]
MLYIFRLSGTVAIISWLFAAILFFITMVNENLFSLYNTTI